MTNRAVFEDVAEDKPLDGWTIAAGLVAGVLTSYVVSCIVLTILGVWFDVHSLKVLGGMLLYQDFGAWVNPYAGDGTLTLMIQPWIDLFTTGLRT
jgi:hypothetical protein